MHNLVKKAIFKSIYTHRRNGHPGSFYKNAAPENFVIFIGKHLCQRFFSIEMQTGGLQLCQKQASVQVFSSEFCQTFTNIYFVKTYECPILPSLERKGFVKAL